MILKQLVLHLDRIFNKKLALSWDKIGLQIGNLESDIKKILITLDATGGTVGEAVSKNCGLILAHHPLIFDSLDTILSSGSGEKKILTLIENKVAFYCAHTNYDAMAGGLNDFAAGLLGLVNTGVIEDQDEQWYKFVVFVPVGSEEKVRKTICDQGSGKWRNYSCCTFSARGKGTFTPHEGSKPFIGKTGKMSLVDEVRIECIVGRNNLDELIKAVVSAHPYEEVAYDVYRIENKFKDEGIGRYGELEVPCSFKDFTAVVKDKLKIENLRWMFDKDTDIASKKIKKVALVCGSANSLSGKLADIDCDLVLVGEIGYHNAEKIIESGKVVMEIGHGISEKPAIDGMYNKLKSFFLKQKIEMDILKSKTGYRFWRYKFE